MSTGLVTAIVAAAVALIMAAIVMTVAAVKLWRAADAANEAIDTVRKELVPLLQESRVTVRNADDAVASISEKAERIGRLLVLIEELIGGSVVAVAASKAAQSSSVALKGLAEALKFGLRALRGAPKES